MSRLHYAKVEIESVSKALGIALRLLGREKSVEIRGALARLYSVEPSMPLRFSYQNLDVSTSYYAPGSWTLVGEILNCSPVYLFLNPDEEIEVWELESSKDLQTLLANTFGFAFYAGPSDLAGLVILDDHDVLIGLGIYAPVVKALATGSKLK